MTTIERNLSQIDGANVPPPTQNGFTATGLQVFPNDAAYEAAYPSFGQGSKYFNSTELLEREHDGTSWVYVNKALTATTDAATTGTDNDLSATRFDLIRFTEGSLQSIRSIDPAQHKIIYMVNDQASQSITWVNEDGTATAANTIITGTGDDLIQEVDQVLAFIYDTESSRWRIAGGTGAGGGGLEIAIITNAESPVTGEIGKWYLTDTSAGPITVNMPDLSAIPSSKQASASMRFSDCKANWQVQPVTLVPFSGQSIDGAVADETMVLDVEAQHVWCARESASNWCFDTSIQPTLESGGGTGEGRVNLFSNSNFEDGTTGWSSTKPAQIGLETSTPLQGAQSLKITSDGAGQVVSTTLTVSDDAYKGIQHGIEGTIDIPLTATTGDWVARFKRNGTTIANSESDLAPGRNRLQDLMAGFAPLLDTITFEIEDVSATASDVATCDIFVLTPQGQGNVTEWPSYDENDFTFTHPWTLDKLSVRPYKTANDIRLAFEFSLDRGSEGSFTDATFTFSDVSFHSGFDVVGQAVETFLTGSGVSNGRQSTNGGALPGSGDVRINTDTTNVRYVSVRGDVLLDSWPTWATKGGNIQLLDNNGLYQNARVQATLPSTQTLGGASTTTLVNFSTNTKVIGFIDNGDGTYKVLSSGEYRYSASLAYADQFVGTTNYWGLNDGSSFIGKRHRIQPSIANTNPTFANEVTLTAGQDIGIYVERDSNSGTRRIASDESTFSIERIPDSTGAQATGAGTSSLANENPQNVLVNYQTYTMVLTNDGAANMNGTVVFTRVGNVVTYTSAAAITHDSAHTPASTSAVPEDFRPSFNAYNCYRYSETAGYTSIIQSNGIVVMQYRNETTTVNQTNSVVSINGSYVIT